MKENRVEPARQGEEKKKVIECIHSFGHNWKCDINANPQFCTRNSYTQGMCPFYIPVKPEPKSEKEEICERCNGDKRGANSPIGFISPCPGCNGTGKEPVKQEEKGVEKNRELLEAINDFEKEILELWMCEYDSSKADKVFYAQRKKLWDEYIPILRSFFYSEYIGEVEKIIDKCKRCELFEKLEYIEVENLKQKLTQLKEG